MNMYNNFTESELINMEKIQDKFGGDFRMTPKHNMMYCCPYCEEKRGKIDNDYKLGIDIATGAYFCFKCHTKGFLFNYTNSNSERIIPFLLEYFNMNDTKQMTTQDSVINSKLLELSDTIPIYHNSLAYEYLKERQITDEQINYYNIKNGIGNNVGRIIIPNVMVANWTDFYQGRSYVGDKNKYNNPSEVDKSNIVFNLHNQRKYQDNFYIVEGVFSAIRAGKNVGSIYGSSISENQIKKIKSYKFKNIYCCLDGDSPGQIGNKHLANELLKNNKDSNIYVVKLPENEDPADMGELKFKRYCEDNKNIFINDKIHSILSYFS